MPLIQPSKASYYKPSRLSSSSSNQPLSSSPSSSPFVFPFPLNRSRQKVRDRMLIDKDQDLRLSLGLSSSEAGCSLQLNLMPSSSPPPTAICLTQSEQRTVLTSQGIEIEEDAGATSSPNSTVSTENCGGKRRFYAGGGEEIDGDEEDGDGSRKKLRLSKDQAAILEESFKENNTLNPKQKLALANKLNLRPRQVEVWFQNRRARTKLKQTEVDCEFLKLRCENLREENRRLQKEVQELRSLKLSPQVFMHMTPPTTLTMCPSCERIAVSNSTAPPPPPPAKLPRADMHQLFPLPIRHPVAGMPTWAPLVLRSSFLNATAKPQRS